MIKNIYLKYKKIINYLVFGFLTTIVNLLTYYLLVLTILNPNQPKELQIANIISWIISVTFAYITNRIYVFKSKNQKTKELLKFYTSRLITLFLDIILMYILVTKLHLNDKIIKLITSFIIIILNYIISKLLVFKKTKP